MSEEAPAEETPESPAGKGGLLKIGVAVVLLMAAEAGALLFLLPGGSAEAADAEATATDKIAEGMEELAAGSDLVEVELSPGFAVTNSTADLGTLVHVNCDLVCAVSGKNRDVFAKSAEEDYRNRIRQVVTEILRSASLEELQDPDMNQLKRRIREDINKTLQHSYVVEVIVPKMQVHVQ